MKLVFGILMLVFFMSSCEGFFEATKEIDLGEYAGELAVVGRLINTDLDTVEDYESLEHLGVLVSRSKSVLDTSSFDLIDNADLLLSSSDGEEKVYEYDDETGLYLPIDLSDRLVVKENTRYELSVNVPGEDRVTAVCETKTFGKIKDINIIQNDIEGDNNTMLDRIQIEIEDPEGENYYLLKVLYKIKNIRDGEDRSYIRQGYLYSYSSVFDESPELFSDELFDGTTDVLEFWSERYIDRINEMGDREVPDQAIVFVWSLSKEEYEFRSSLDINRDAEDNPFSEPSIVFSNIENGIGVFSMSRVERIPIPWKQ